MEAMKRSAGFAESQIRLLLADLKSSSQSARVKAVKRFQDYINTYRPDVSSCKNRLFLLLFHIVIAGDELLPSKLFIFVTR